MMNIEENGKEQKRLAEVLLVGVDSSNEDKFTLVVGKKDVEAKTTEILNIIQGDRAKQLYRELLHAISIPTPDSDAK